MIKAVVKKIKIIKICKKKKKSKKMINVGQMKSVTVKFVLFLHIISQ